MMKKTIFDQPNLVFRTNDSPLNTRLVKYVPQKGTDEVVIMWYRSEEVEVLYNYITSMEYYKNASFEELRLADYELNADMSKFTFRTFDFTPFEDWNHNCMFCGTDRNEDCVFNKNRDDMSVRRKPPLKIKSDRIFGMVTKTTSFDLWVAGSSSNVGCRQCGHIPTASVPSLFNQKSTASVPSESNQNSTSSAPSPSNQNSTASVSRPFKQESVASSEEPSCGVNSWYTILKTGLEQSDKETLIQNNPTLQHSLLRAPVLNEEIKRKINNELKNLDKDCQDKQDQIGNALSAIVKAISLFIDEQRLVHGIQALYSAFKIFADLHYCITRDRMKQIAAALDDDLSFTLMESERDDTLFGKNLKDRVDVDDIKMKKQEINVRTENSVSNQILGPNDSNDKENSNANNAVVSSSQDFEPNNKVTTKELPISTNKVPVSTSEVSASTIEGPVSTKEVNISTNKVPVLTKKVPVSTNELSASTTEGPVSTKEVPVSINKVSASTIEGPVSTSEVNISTNKVPVSTKKVPVSTNEVPVSIIEGPVSTKEVLVPINKVSASTIEGPVSTKEVPVLINKLSASTIEGPVSTNEVNISTDKVPVSTKEIPVSINEVSASTIEGTFSTKEVPVLTNKVPVSTKELPVSTNEAAVSIQESAISSLESQIAFLQTEIINLRETLLSLTTGDSGFQVHQRSAINERESAKQKEWSSQFLYKQLSRFRDDVQFAIKQYGTDNLLEKLENDTQTISVNDNYAC